MQQQRASVRHLAARACEMEVSARSVREPACTPWPCANLASCPAQEAYSEVTVNMTSPPFQNNEESAKERTCACVLSELLSHTTVCANAVSTCLAVAAYLAHDA
jgi:hypothetical protein